MRRELLIFLVVGALTVLIDWAVYRGLLALALPVTAAKGSSFIIGTLFAYLANKFWTFRSKGTVGAESSRFVLVYGSSLLANMGINALTLAALPAYPESLYLAFLLATGTSASLNFLGMKFFVFTPRVRGSS